MKYNIESGNRRFLAMKKLGWKMIPCILGDKMIDVNVDDISIGKNSRIDINDSSLSDLMSSIKQQGILYPPRIYTKNEGEESEFIIKNIVENVQRVDITPMELGRACNELTRYGLNIKEVSVRLGVPENKVKVALKIYKMLPKEYSNKIQFKDGNTKNITKIPATVANRILSICNATEMNSDDIKRLFQYAYENSITTHEIELIARLSRSSGIEDALINYKKYRLVQIRVGIFKEEVKDELENGKSPTSIIREVLTGKREPFKNCFINM